MLNCCCAQPEMMKTIQNNPSYNHKDVSFRLFIKLRVKPIQDGPFGGCARLGGGEGRLTPYLKFVIHIPK